MSEEVHPSELNLFKQYRRTVNLSKSTSRMKNKAWYQDALALDVQIHCYMKDSQGADCYLHVKSSNHYEKIGELSSRQLEKHDELEQFIKKTLKLDAVGKAKSLGVILYLADELSIASLGPEHQNPVEIMNLRQMIVQDPKEVLEDKTVSVETHSWRLFPYTGASAGSEFATTVAVSRRMAGTLKTFREIGSEMNLPIRTCALSAPLCAIASLPWCTAASEHGTIAVLNYQKFTLLAFFNTYCDLAMLRYMPHAKGASTPSSLGSAVFATATAFELENPEILMISLVGNNLEGAVVSLQGSMLGSEIIHVDTSEVMRLNGLPEGIPIEVMATSKEIDKEKHTLCENTTFTALSEEAWHLQDFHSPSQDEIDMSPGAEDMKLLKMSKLVKRIAAVLLFGFLAYSGYNIASMVKSDAWAHKPSNGQTTAVALNTELMRYQRWDRLLKDRSKAWVSMELIQRLAPADGSVVLKDVKHTVAKKKSDGTQNYGFTKQWVINGYASSEGLHYLENLSTRDGIKKIFHEVAAATGNEAYKPDVDQRDITVSLKQRANPTYNTISPSRDGDMFRITFTLSITQSFGAKDSMALASINQPKAKK